VFPIGSDLREALIRVLEKHVASDTIANMLKFSGLKIFTVPISDHYLLPREISFIF